MSKINDAKLIVANKPGIARSVIACMLLAFAVGCGDAETPRVYIGPGPGGSVGSGGASGTGGTVGTGGVGGVGAMGGNGGMSGGGGSAGTGGTGSTGGTGGTGGSLGLCATNALCHTCPDQFLCQTDDDCTFSGYVCVASGCETHGGAPIKQCQPSRGGSCIDDNDCPNGTDYACIKVGAGGDRCVRVTAGCDPATETFDCPPGFSCESGGSDGACVDRRMPCDSYLDCPKSHLCTTTTVSSYCTRTHRTCHEDTDCGGFAAAGSFCADVDNDGTKECVGELGDPPQACVNADCGGSAPVCEMGAAPTAASCGDYGLCRSNNDCDTGFVCVGLWQDGRRECVPADGTCDQVTDCPLQQVCAAPRNGGSPSCQAGKEAM